MTMRLPQDEQEYQEAKANNSLVPINTEPPVMEFKYWRVVKNRFPHSRISTRNDMLVLKRDGSMVDLTDDELFELRNIFVKLDHHYDVITHNFASMRSINAIPHFHLYNLKKTYK